MESSFLALIFLGARAPPIAAALEKGDEFVLGAFIGWRVHRLTLSESQNNAIPQLSKE